VYVPFEAYVTPLCAPLALVCEAWTTPTPAGEIRAAATGWGCAIGRALLICASFSTSSRCKRSTSRTAASKRLRRCRAARRHGSTRRAAAVIRSVHAELFKLRTSPGPWVVLGATLLFTALGIVVVFLVGKGHGHVRFVAPVSTFRLRRLIGSGFAVGGIWMAAVVGVLAVTGEYRHKTMTQTLLVEPRRGTLLAAKAVAALIWGIGLAIASLLFVGAMGLPLLHTEGGSVSRLFDQAGAVLPGLFAAFALLALLGAGLGTLVKNQVAAVVTILAITFIVEPVLDGLLPEVGRWLPSAAAAAVAGGLAPAGERAHLLSWWLAAIVLAAWGLVPIVVGYFVTFDQDVT